MGKVKSTAIGILGMHRSGTSLITRVVSLLGAYIGKEKELLLPKPDNIMGNCEQYAINDIHDRTLKAFGRTWDTAFPLPSGWLDSRDVVPIRDELIHLIESRFANWPLWAWKDPRSSILLPLWKDVLVKLNIELRCLLVFRNPLDVARSLWTRDGFSRDESFGLWLNHNLTMLNESVGLKRALVSYEGFVADPIESLARWAPRFSLRWSPENKQMLESIRQIVRSDLCHSASTLEDLTQMGCPQPVTELARLLDVMAKTGTLENSPYESEICRLVENHVLFAGLYSHDFTQTVRANRKLQAKKNRLESVSIILDQIRTKLNSVEESLIPAQTTVGNQETPLRKQESIVTFTKKSMKEVENRLAELQSHIAFQNQMLAESKKELAEKDAALLEKNNALTESLLMQTRAERQLAGMETRYKRILETYSWRITSPLRAVLDSVISVKERLRAFRIRLSSRSSLGTLPSMNVASAPISDDSSAEVAGTSQSSSAHRSTEVPKLIAFYLPQFHPIPENDKWWGKGFTEWTNVSRSRALFKGHHQPRQPTDLGYYDLRVAEVQEAQAEMARAYGIHGFCYYYYWFDGRRLLERPLDHLLNSGTPDFPFCLCWANESWSRRWDGSEDDILIGQKYSPGFAEQFAGDIAHFLLDPRYIRVGGRPLLIVYRLDQIPDPKAVATIWRKIFRDRGVGEVVLGAVESFGHSDPTQFGFDVAIEFPPHNPPPAEYQVDASSLRATIQDLNPDFQGLLRDYRDLCT